MSEKLNRKSSFKEIKKETSRTNREPKNYLTGMDLNLPKIEPKKIASKPNFISKIFFSQFSSLFQNNKGNGRIEMSRFEPLEENMQFFKILTKVENLLEKSNSPIIEIGSILFKLVRKDLLISFLLENIYNILSISIPYTLNKSISSLLDFEKKKKNLLMYTLKLFFWAVISIIISFTRNIFKQHTQMVNSRVGARVLQSLRAIYYKKITRCNFQFLRYADASFVARIIFFEFDSIAVYITHVNKFFSIPITFLMSLGYIFLILKLSFFAILLTFSITCILIYLIEKKISRKKLGFKNSGSERVLLITEILNNILSIKANLFEDFFTLKLQTYREKEKLYLKKLFLWNNLLRLVCLFCIIGSIFFCLIFTTGTAENSQETELSQSLAIVALLNFLRKPLMDLSSTFDYLVEYRVAIKALNKFLNLISEVEKIDIKNFETSEEPIIELKFNCSFVKQELEVIEAIEDILNNSTKFKLESDFRSMLLQMKGLKQKITLGKKTLELIKSSKKNLQRDEIKKQKKLSKRVNLKYLAKSNISVINKSNGRILLKDIDLKIKRGEKVCIINLGEEESDNLIHTLLGEAKIDLGTVERRGSFGYLDVENPVFFYGKTIRENIIFGDEFQDARYYHILDLVKLDIKKFKGQDMMQVLEKGRNISYIERNKILLARMLYAERDIYLIRSYGMNKKTTEKDRNQLLKLLRGAIGEKTVLIFSKGIEFAQFVDRVLILQNKTLIEEGNYQTLLKSRNRVIRELFKSQPIFFQKRHSTNLKDVVKTTLLINRSRLVTATGKLCKD